MPESAPVTVTVPAGAAPFVYLKDRQRIHLQHHVEVPLQAVKAGAYTIEGLCDQAVLEMFLLDPDGVVIASAHQTQRRRFKLMMSAELKRVQRYTLVIGADSSKEARVRVGVTTGSIMHIGQDPSRRVSAISREGTEKRSLSPQSGSFQGGAAQFFEVDRREFAGQWLRIRMVSGAFDPVLYALDRDDDVVAYSDDRAPGISDSELVLGPNSAVTTLAATAYRLNLGDGANESFGDYQIVVEAFPYEPTPFFIGWLNYLAQSPLVSFGSGSVVTIIVGYIFFLKTVKTRSVSFEEEADHLLMNDKQDSEPMLFATGDRALRCASIYQFRIWHSGHSRITQDLVRKPLAVRLDPVVSIASFRHETNEGSSWLKPAIDNTRPVTITFPFERLDRGDRITVTVLCEQESPATIEPTFTADIAETAVRHVDANIQNWMWWVLLSTNLIFIVSAPLLMVDVLVFDFKLLPNVVHRIISWTWIPVCCLQLGLFLLSGRGRRIFRGMVTTAFSAEPARQSFRRLKRKTRHKP